MEWGKEGDKHSGFKLAFVELLYLADAVHSELPLGSIYELLDTLSFEDFENLEMGMVSKKFRDFIWEVQMRTEFRIVTSTMQTMTCKNSAQNEALIQMRFSRLRS